jgi:beta-lactamase regulating signal transducer with metallopeptidase domain
MAVAASLYVGVALLLVTRFFVGLAFSRRLQRSALKIEEVRLSRRLWRCARSSRLASPPDAFESELIAVPLTIGVVHPTILLPGEWRSWDDTKLDAVIAHEVSHVARRDALTQRLSLVYRAIFWFSPLAWWINRHLSDLAEQASDEAALRCGADRVDYARTLLEFFQSLQSAPGRVWWQGVSMAKVGQAEKRLERILSWKGTVAMSLKRSVAIVVLAVSLPLVYLAASVHADNSHWNPQSVGGPQSPTPAISAQPPAAAPKVRPEFTAEPATAPAIAPSPAGAQGTPQSEPASAASSERPSVAPAAAPAPAAPVAPVAAPSPAPSGAWSAQSSHSNSSYGHGYSYAYGYDDEQRFVIVSGKSDSLTMSGTTEDARRVEKLRKQIPGDFIWFQSDEKSYIIRDQATIDRAKKLWAPQEELGKKQEELGKQQNALGKQQEALGKKMEQIHVNVPDMTAELDKLKAELKQLSAGATVEQVGRIQSEIGDLQSKIADLQSKAGDQQGKLGEEMGALGEQQGKLGEQQGELGRQQGEMAREASRKMKQLLEEAIAKGIAQLEL